MRDGGARADEPEGAEMTLFDVVSARHSRIWWDDYLALHPGIWQEAEGWILARAQQGVGWLVSELLN